MVFSSRRSKHPFFAVPATSETVAEHRARMAQEQEIAHQRKAAALTGQVAMTNSPSQRILIWEHLHALPLPNSPDHKLLEVIAAATDLRIEQVQEVQKLRAARGTQATDPPGES